MENTIHPDDVIYPEVLFTENESMMVAWTRLRKRSNGKYYFWDYKQVRYCKLETDRSAEKEKLIAQLHFEIYIIQVMGKINTFLKKSGINEFGVEEQVPLFEKDISQKSEERRLIEKYQLSNQSN